MKEEVCLGVGVNERGDGVCWEEMTALRVGGRGRERMSVVLMRWKRQRKRERCGGVHWGRGGE